MPTLLLAGKQPTAPIVAPKFDRFTPFLEATHRLSSNGNRLLTMQKELARLDRRCGSRLKKLDDPALRDHPGYDQAREEWFFWNATAIAVNVDLFVFAEELQREAIIVDGLFQAMPVNEQQGVLDLVSYWFPQTTELVKAWPEIRALKGWKTLLRAWGSRYEEVPF